MYNSIEVMFCNIGVYMEIKYHKRAVKFINSLPIKERQRIKEGIYKMI